MSPVLKKKPPSSAPSAGLRDRAEAQLQKRLPARPQKPSEAETQRLLHELQVHQVELEMQNAELHRSRLEIEAALDRYTELYDFAPVGYFSIDQQGLIQEVNLTGAAMLGVVRSRLLQRRLQGFVAPSSRPGIDAFLKNVFAGPGKQACEASLLTATGAAFWADLQASSTIEPASERKWCRLAISDIAALKRGQEAQRRVETLAAAYQSANREIVRRRAAEVTLKASERNQRELLAKAQKMHAQLQHLTHQILLAQEEERKKISRQLHDEIAQILIGISVQLATFKKSTAIPPWDLRRRTGKIIRLVTRSIDVVHRFARDLRPSVLDDLGLIPALRSFLKELAARNGLRIQFTAFAGGEALDNIRRTALYRVAQEALTNVTRHAHAHHVTVRLLNIPHAIRLEIHDDGKSFPVERMLAAKRGGRLGLLGMRERIEMIGGRFAIQSAPGEGTTVSAEIPFE